jgi:hypothetical protein
MPARGGVIREFLRRGGWLVVLPLFVIVVALNSAAGSRAAAARLAAEGIEVRATITGKHEERSWAPGVRSKYLEPTHVLRFSYSSGSVLRGDFHVGTGEAHVSQQFYDSVEEDASVPLRILKDEDAVFELEPGSLQAEADNALGVAALIAAICVPLFLLVGRGALRAVRSRNANPPGSA